MIVTVTLNAAIDRTLTVPNFQRGQRHRASSGLALAGGKGINVARALKALRVPVVATGLAGGQTGTRILEELTARVDPQRLRPHRGRVAHLDRRRRPAGGTFTEINEWGPAVRPEELETLLEKLDYLTQGADARRVRRLAAAGRRGRLLRRGDPHARAQGRPRRARLRRRAAAAGDRGRAAARLAEPARGRGRRRPRVPRRRGLRARPRPDRRPGRAQRDHHDRVRLLRPAARGARDRAATAWSHRASSRCRASAPATRCSARSSPRAPRAAPPEEQLRAAVAAGAASTFELGAGRFDPRHAAGSQPAVEVSELTPVAESARLGIARCGGVRPGCPVVVSPMDVERRRRSRRRAASSRRRRARTSARGSSGSSARRGSPSTTSARAGRVGRAAERRLDRDAADAHDRAQRARRLGGDGHGHRGADGDRARPRGRDRGRPPQPPDRGAGRRDRQGQALRGGDDRRAADPASRQPGSPTRWR